MLHACDNVEQLEARRQELQYALDAGKTSSERNRLGQFATPNLLAIEMARTLLSYWDRSPEPIDFADPSAGTGSFISAAISTLELRRLRSIRGIELDPAFCAAAKNIWVSPGVDILEGDFTKLVSDPACQPPPNFILANPPYVRHHHLHTSEKNRLRNLVRQRCGLEINGLASFYIYFLILATEWMREDGVAGWLVPSEFMDVNYGAALKTYLTSRVTLFRVHRFSPEDVQFGDALVSSSILFFRKHTPPLEHRIEFSYGGSLDRPTATEVVLLDALRRSRKWTCFPVHDSNDRRECVSDGPALADLFRIQRGIATGANSFFIIERGEAERLNIPRKFLQPILPSPRFLKSAVIEGAPDGYPAIAPQLCLLDCELAEEVLEHAHPELWSYLNTAKANGLHEGYLCSKRNPWYRQERRAVAPFLCTYMGIHDAEW